jgi:hypothetical protein
MVSHLGFHATGRSQCGIRILVIHNSCFRTHRCGSCAGGYGRTSRPGLPSPQVRAGFCALCRRRRWFRGAPGAGAGTIDPAYLPQPWAGLRDSYICLTLLSGSRNGPGEWTLRPAPGAASGYFCSGAQLQPGQRSGQSGVPGPGGYRPGPSPGRAADLQGPGGQSAARPLPGMPG